MRICLAFDSRKYYIVKANTAFALCVRHCSRFLVHMKLLNRHSPMIVYSSSFTWMKKLVHGWVKSLAQGYSSVEWCNVDLHVGSLVSKPVFSPPPRRATWCMEIVSEPEKSGFRYSTSVHGGSISVTLLITQPQVLICEVLWYLCHRAYKIKVIGNNYNIMIIIKKIIVYIRGLARNKYFIRFGY